MRLHLDYDNSLEYTSKIRQIYNESFSKNNNIVHLYLEHLLYLSFCDLGNFCMMKDSLLWMISEYFKNNSITETYDVISELFLRKYSGCYPANLRLEIKGCEYYNSLKFITPQNPRKYNRVFYEYTLDDYLEYRRNEIMTHYNFWNNTDNQ